MKKSILIALAVAVATCAQGQSELGDNPTEYKNPFASLGVYEYVQKQSDGEYGKWFLSGKNAEDRYFTIDAYKYSTVRTAKVVVNKDGNFNDVQFCITLDLSDKFKNTDKNYIEISCVVYNDRDLTQYPYMEYELSMGTELEKNEITNLSSLLNNKKKDNITTYRDKSYHYSLKNNIQVNQDKYLHIQFNCGKNAGIFYFGNIIITGYTYDNDNNRVDVFKESYFDISLYLVQFDTKGGNEIDNMYYFVNYPKHYILDNNLNEMAFLEQLNYNNGYIETHLKWNDGCLPTPIREGYNFKYWELDGEKYDSSIKSNDITLTAVWEKNGEIITDITTTINDMESNIYVSNNVLHTDEPSNVYIFNAGGILVKTENNTTSVDLSDLKKGVYIAKVNGAPIKFVR